MAPIPPLPHEESAIKEEDVVDGSNNNNNNNMGLQGVQPPSE
eukprot:CAMPEP_0197849144 /NCGR_PEP_ID=MMETSP1438-20131217/11039_1 /TAXON_ID=1461541 /ORGANISM="Pterosperma sp., Strain CCMP1384" /LENGTH=41 /DNA_ID= /DNA_START= /DNA_END= /DNA_ORIENTATION=